MKLSMSDARRLALRCQGLDGRWGLPAGKEGVARAIERLGYVQIDTIAVVQRAHHHTLWARCPDYDPQMLHELQARDRRVFEWWASAASYIPMCDYRYYLPRMRAAARQPRTRKWMQENRQLVEDVLARIRAEGPLGSADFEAPDGFNRGTWWSWKPAKRALETLFDCGELMVTERRNFQRLYDLRERVLPPDVDTTEPAAGEVARFETRRALGSLGFAPVDDVRWRQWASQRTGVETVHALVDAGEVVTFEIEGMDGQTFCALAEVLAEAVGLQEDGTPLHILSPFDNLVIRRGWLKTFFGFDYRLEAYTPAAKRRYGYFCLPLLWGERFVGRMDAKADRKPGTFIVRRLTFEPSCGDFDALLPALVTRLRAFAAFNGCERIVVEQTEPAYAGVPLARALSLPFDGSLTVV